MRWNFSFPSVSVLIDLNSLCILASDALVISSVCINILHVSLLMLVFSNCDDTGSNDDVTGVDDVMINGAVVGGGTGFDEISWLRMSLKAWVLIILSLIIHLKK